MIEPGLPAEMRQYISPFKPILTQPPQWDEVAMVAYLKGHYYRVNFFTGDITETHKAISYETIDVEKYKRKCVNGIMSAADKRLITTNWPKYECELLVEYLDKGYRVERIATVIQRPLKTIRRKIRMMGWRWNAITLRYVRTGNV